MRFRFESPVLGIQFKSNLKVVFPENKDSVLEVLCTAPDEMVVLAAMMMNNLKVSAKEEKP